MSKRGGQHAPEIPDQSARSADNDAQPSALENYTIELEAQPKPQQQGGRLSTQEHGIEVNGHTVKYKTSFKVRENDQMNELLMKAAESQKTRDQIRLLRQVIEEWDYDGDPKSASSYEDLDPFADILPMFAGFTDWVGQRIQRDPVKN